jgi:hypothetical protein
MYEAKFDHGLDIKAIKRAYELRNEDEEILKATSEIKRAFQNPKNNSLTFYLENGSVTYFSDGRIRSSRKGMIRKGIDLLLDLNIILLDTNPEIYKV